MVREAPLERTEDGVVPAGEGWFVLNVREAQWFGGGELGGLYTSFEGENARFAELGFGLARSRFELRDELAFAAAPADVQRVRDPRQE